MCGNLAHNTLIFVCIFIHQLSVRVRMSPRPTPSVIICYSNSIGTPKWDGKNLLNFILFTFLCHKGFARTAQSAELLILTNSYITLQQQNLMKTFALTSLSDMIRTDFK